jgi:hypothetical protein
MADDPPRHVRPLQQFRPPGGDLMEQDIGALGEANQVFSDAGVPREYD